MQIAMHKTVSIVVGTIGLMLLAMMVVVEDEPGAIPLALVAGGVIGYITAHIRGRRSRQP